MSNKKEYDDVFASDDDHHVDHFSEADAFGSETEDVDPFGMPADSEQDIYASDDHIDAHAHGEGYQEDFHAEGDAYHQEGMGLHADQNMNLEHGHSGSEFSEQFVEDVPQKKSSSKLKAAIAVGLFGLVGGAGMLFLLNSGQPAQAPMMLGNDMNNQQGQQFQQGVPTASQDDINRLASQLDPNQLRQLDAQAYIEEHTGDTGNPLAALTGGTQPQVAQTLPVPMDNPMMGTNQQTQSQWMDQPNGQLANDQSGQYDPVTTSHSAAPVLSVSGMEEAGSVMDLVNTLTGYVDNNSVRINEIERRMSSAEGRLEALKDEILSEIAATRAIDAASSTSVASRSNSTQASSNASANTRTAETSADGFYTVVANDNLSAIARRFGVSTDDLAKNNGIVNKSIIFAGQRLRVDGGTLSDAEIQQNRARTQSVASTNRSSGATSRTATPRNLSQWKIAGLSPSRAVLIDGQGQYHTVAVGETVAGGGRIEMIDVAGNRVVTSTGVIQFIH